MTGHRPWPHLRDTTIEYQAPPFHPTDVDRTTIDYGDTGTIGLMLADLVLPGRGVEMFRLALDRRDDSPAAPSWHGTIGVRHDDGTTSVHHARYGDLGLVLADLARRAFP